MATTTEAVAATTKNATAHSDSAKVYDRQIRLWGKEAQKRIMESHVLVVGASAVHVEAAKNLYLAGLYLSVFDETPIKLSHTTYNYFVSAEDIDQPCSIPFCRRIQEMNPFAQIVPFRHENLLDLISNIDSHDRESAEMLFSQFTAICIAHEFIPFSKLIQFDKFCREMQKGLFVSVCCGDMGWFFSDMGTHKIEHTTSRVLSPQSADENIASIEESPNGEISMQRGPSTDDAQKEVTFPSLLDAQNVSLKQFKKIDPQLFAILSFLQSTPYDASEIKVSIEKGITQEAFPNVKPGPLAKAVAECNTIAEKIGKSVGQPFIPVATVLGGLLGQEVVKFVTKQGDPLCNFVMFSQESSAAMFVRSPPL